MEDKDINHSGRPGEPGEPGSAESGGAGGAGGVGGYGGTTGGEGGVGGAGGPFSARNDAMDAQHEHMQNREAIVRWFKIMVISNVITILMVLAIGTVGFISNKNRGEEGQQALHGLCALRQDVARRYRDNQDLLRFQGPVLDPIIKKALLVSLKGQSATLQALEFLDCNEKGTQGPQIRSP